MNVSRKTVLLATIMAGWLSLHVTAQEEGQYGSGGDSYALEHPSAVPICLAKYSGGDWDYGTHFDAKETIDGGSLYHLMASITEWSHGRIKARATWIDMGSPKLPSVPPPIIVFTGTKDFSLSDQEIKNLRSYLQLGGKIWGNNAKGGRGSEFDLAFRREMKRVAADPHKKFEPMASTESIFTQSWFDLSKSPEGTGSVEYLEIKGAKAIIYTHNNTLDNSESKERLGMNIIGSALIRFDEAPLHH